MGLLFLVGIVTTLLAMSGGDDDDDALPKGTLVPPPPTEGAVIPVDCYPVDYHPNHWPPEYLAQVATNRPRNGGPDRQWWGMFHEPPIVYRGWVICLEKWGSSGEKIRVSVWRQRAGRPIELSYESNKIWNTTSQEWPAGEGLIARNILEKGLDPMVVDSPDNGITSLERQKMGGDGVEGPY